MTPTQKTVVHLLSNRWNSAITEYALSAAVSLRLEGWRSVFVPLQGSPAEARARSMDLEVIPLSRFSAGAILDVKKLFVEANPQLVMTYGGPETLLARVAKGLFPEVRIIRFRGHGIPEGQVFFKERHRLSHSHCSMIITPADYLTTPLSEVSGCPVETLVLGIDDNKYCLVEEGAARTRDIIILGRLDPVKGHQDFLKKFAQILANWDEPTWRPRLRIIGEAENISVLQIQKYVNEVGLHLERDVSITSSRVENISKLMATSIAGIIPSLGSEVICRVAEEFLLCGAPIAVSGVGSLDEVLTHRDFGMSWSKMSAEGTISALKEFIKASYLESGELRKKRAEAAKDTFSYRTMGLRLSELISTV